METATRVGQDVREQHHLVGGKSFRVRVRLSGGTPGGWVWFAAAEEHPWQEADLRGWHTPEAAEHAALRRLEQRFGDEGEEAAGGVA